MATSITYSVKSDTQAQQNKSSGIMDCLCGGKYCAVRAAPKRDVFLTLEFVINLVVLSSQPILPSIS